MRCAGGVGHEYNCKLCKYSLCDISYFRPVLQFSVFNASHLCCVILSNEVEWSTVLSPYREFPPSTG